MKPHKILKSFPGSQHGNDHQFFEEGAIEPLSDELAAIVVKEGWAKPVKATSSFAAPEAPALKENEPLPEESSDSSAEQKSEDEAPSNKTMKAAPENKAKRTA